MGKRAWPVISALVTTTVLVTCSYPALPKLAGDGGARDGGIDGKVFLDAPKPNNEIGMACNGTGSGSTGCPSVDPYCLTLMGSDYFCDLSCGTGSCAAGGTAGSASCSMNGSNYPMAPSGGDSICQQQQPSSSATPACALYSMDGSGSGNMAIDWFCGLVCGTIGSANYGTCPPGLTCTGNICQ